MSPVVIGPVDSKRMYIAVCSRIFLALMWLLAGCSKLSDIQRLRDSVRSFGVASDRVASAVSRALPWMEIAIGSALFVPTLQRIGAVISGILLFGFMSLTAHSLLRGRVVHCSCFGSFSKEPLSWRSVIRNAWLLLVSAAATGLLPFAKTRPGDVSTGVFLAAAIIDSIVLLWCLIIAALWKMLVTAALADSGPTVGMLERSILRNWFHVGHKL